jgi:protein FRA10AC1
VRSIGTDSQIDLKHYKSRRLALRWRTAEEVVEGIGEDTCASLRCKYHQTPKATDTQVEFEDETRNRGRSKRPKTRNIPALRAFELPFVYNEAGERKEALVKVRLCGRCEGNLTWRPGRKEESSEEDKVEKPRSTRRGDRKGKRREYGSRSRSPSRSRSRSRSPARREDREREEIRERRLI